MLSAQSSQYSDLSLNDQDFAAIDAAAAEPDLLADAENWSFHDDEDFSASVRVPTRRSKPGFERLRVLEVADARLDNGRLYKRVKCQRAKSTDLLLVNLCDDWQDTPIKVGDKVHVIGDFDINSSSSHEPISADRTITVSAMENTLILHPDILISVTKVADTAFCSRKALISERVRTVGEQKSKALVYGNIIHEVIQRCLSNGGDFTPDNVDNNLRSLLKVYLADIWESDLDFNASFEECKQKLQNVYNFDQTYFGATPKPEAKLYDARANPNESPTLAIDTLCALEDDIWSPKYGLKGKVDATVRGSLDLKSEGLFMDVIMPLEIKTGKSTIGIEHRAQTMIYSMMVAERYGSTIPSGLLWYTTDNSIKRVTPRRNELRGLIIKRNTLAYHMSRKEPSQFLKRFNGIKIEDQPADIEDSILPPTVDNPHACPRCFVVDACMLYKAALEGPANAKECDIHDLVEKKTGQLTSKQTDFFRAWEELISIEETESFKFRKHLWTLDGSEREKKGLCYSNLKITDFSENPAETQDVPETSYRTGFVYRFSKDNMEKLSQSQIIVNDAVLISIEPDIVAMGKGFVLAINDESITVGFNTELNRAVFESRADLHTPSSGNYRLDKDEIGNGMAAVRDSLASIFYSQTNPRPRQLIVDLKEPTFTDTVAADKDSKSYRALNKDQKTAVDRALNTNDYALILGMPGTGKTTTVATTIKELVKRGKSVLLASYTHSAVDTILRKLDTSGIDILRLGQRSKIHKDVLAFARTVDSNVDSIESLDKLLMEPRVVATTCLGVNHPLFTKRRFDYCIVDEASQITLPVCLGPIRFSDKFILVGDHYQLPPLVKNDSARQYGLDVSLFRRLCEHHPNAVVHLAHQYRMADDIMYLSNKLVYDDKLVCGNDAVAKQKLELPSAVKLEDDGNWFTEVLRPNNRVLFLNTDSVAARETVDGDLVQNLGEVSIIAKVVEGLLSHGVLEAQIGVISFYRKQMYQLQEKLHKFKSVELLTADRSQGRDKDCIVVSLCRSNTNGQIGELLQDWRRINVSLTRARCKLIVVGSASTISLSDKLAQFVKLSKEKGWMVDVTDDALYHATPHSSPVKAPLSASNASHHSSQPQVIKSRESCSPSKPLKRRQTVCQSPSKENKKIKKKEDYPDTLSIKKEEDYPDALSITHDILRESG